MSPRATYRSLKPEEIERLEKSGNTSGHWSGVRVAEGASVEKIRNADFSGDVCLDANVTIHGAFLNNVSIGANSVIKNCGTIACLGETAFGNGHRINVLNEGGGRELKMTAKTSAQTAYLTVLYRHRPGLISALHRLADTVAGTCTDTQVSIGANCRLQNCPSIINVRVGDYAKIDGPLRLKNGTIESSQKAPTVIGAGVIAEDFIIQQGAHVTDGAMVYASLVGEGVRLGRQFSADNSVFFANSEGLHSEACSLFAGPYSVTHHRSTLLIASMTSFFNAGSGTNQSNHMYKLGPLHQGILERGCKTGSFAYLRFPVRIGPFTALIGRHTANFDTSDFPFSYIIEDQGHSALLPGVNCFTVGTLRDGEKWPDRDRRPPGNHLDLIIFDVLSPFTAQKMIRARKILLDLYARADTEKEFVTHNGITIKRLLLKTGSRYYQMALDRYFGDSIIRRFEAAKTSDIAAVLKFDDHGVAGNDAWLDICGLLAVQSRVNALCETIERGRVNTMDDLQQELRKIHAAYAADAWNWIVANFETVYHIPLTAISRGDLKNFLETWKKSSLKGWHMVYEDARKEFEGGVRISFGIDGAGDRDFEAVRGAFESSPIAKKLRDHMNAVNTQFLKIAGAI